MHLYGHAKLALYQSDSFTPIISIFKAYISVILMWNQVQFTRCYDQNGLTNSSQSGKELCQAAVRNIRYLSAFSYLKTSIY